MISLPNPMAQTKDKLVELEEFLYDSCRQDPDLLATIISEYILSLNDAQLTELEDFLVNNFGDE